MSGIESRTYISKILNNTVANKLALPRDWTTMRVVSDDVTATGITSVEIYRDTGKATVVTNSTTAGASYASSTPSAAGVYLNNYDVIPGTVTTDTETLFFTPTSTGDLDKFTPNAYLDVYNTEALSASKAFIGNSARFVVGKDSTKVNIGLAPKGSPAAALNASVIIHNEFAATNAPIPSDFGIVSKAGNIVTVRASSLPIQLLATELNGEGSLMLEISPTINLDDITGIKKAAIGQSVGTQFKVVSFDTSGGTLSIKDEENILLSTGRFQGSIYSQNGFANGS